MVAEQIETTARNEATRTMGIGQAPATQVIAAPIRQVVLQEDRAVVERRATLQRVSGPCRLIVPAVSAVISDRSLTVHVPDGVRVDDAVVRREWRVGAREQPEDAARVTQERRQWQERLALQEAHKQVARDDRDLLVHATETFFQGLNRELPFAESFRPEWREHIARLFAQLRAADDALCEDERILRESHGKLAAVDLRLAELGRPDHFLATELSVDLTVTTPPAADWTLAIKYVVPCAMWRPLHRAELAAGQLRFACEAAVWQATGEDWTDVELLFSTARSTLRSEPPQLSDDVIRTRPRAEKKIVVAEREQTIGTTGPGMAAPTAIELAGVDDGGETRLLRAPVAATIIADGRVRRVAISHFETPATIERVARPERSTMVHRQARATNAGSHVILAGPVELVRDGATTGRGEIGFVAPQEAFVLGFGGDDALRIQRVTSEERETAKLTGRQTIKHTVELFISNIGPEAASFKLEERIPVSEIEQITVELDAKETKPPAKPDANGIVHWQVSVPAFATEKVKLVYTVQASSDVQGL
jgi:uncharacterized protein (TIGR02231 family)